MSVIILLGIFHTTKSMLINRPTRVIAGRKISELRSLKSKYLQQRAFATYTNSSSQESRFFTQRILGMSAGVGIFSLLSYYYLNKYLQSRSVQKENSIESDIINAKQAERMQEERKKELVRQLTVVFLNNRLDSDYYIRARQNILKDVLEYTQLRGNPNLTGTSFSLLEAAVYYQDTELITLLLKAGANPNSIGPTGKTPLCWTRTLAMAQLLIQYGASSQIKPDGTPTPELEHTLSYAYESSLLALYIQQHNYAKLFDQKSIWHLLAINCKLHTKEELEKKSKMLADYYSDNITIPEHAITEANKYNNTNCIQLKLFLEELAKRKQN